jgi:two-component system sensor histidine kinase HydH
MSDGDEARLRELDARNAILDQQVRTLVRTEQKLYLAQLDLSRQLARVDALNRLAIDVAGVESAGEILRRAADVLFAQFPLDQHLGFLVDSAGLLVPTVVSEAPDREPRGPLFPGDRDATRIAAELPLEAIMGRAGALGRARPEIVPLISRAESVFGDASSGGTAASDAHILVLPIASGGRLVGVMVFRRISGPISFHEELPTHKDLPLLGLFAQQVAAALTNARLVERERLAAVGELAALVAHEVRNPLGVISNSLSMLTRLISGRREEQHLLGIVREEAARLNQIVTDLIEFARPHAPMPREELLSAIAEESLESVRARFQSGVITLSVDDGTPRAWADARLIRQALINLVVNAIQASPEGAGVAVRIGRGADDRWVTIAVIDRGAGIPAGLVSRVFEPFFTGKASGTGLGLAVVQRVADAHGGTIAAAPTPGGGTTFTLSLPAAPRPAATLS